MCVERDNSMREKREDEKTIGRETFEEWLVMLETIPASIVSELAIDVFLSLRLFLFIVSFHFFISTSSMFVQSPSVDIGDRYVLQLRHFFIFTMARGLYRRISQELNILSFKKKKKKDIYVWPWTIFFLVTYHEPSNSWLP